MLLLCFAHRVEVGHANLNQLGNLTHALLGRLLGIEAGREDGKKIIATNEMLVKRAVDAVKTFGKQPATAAEAREILGLKPLVR